MKKLATLVVSAAALAAAAMAPARADPVDMSTITCGQLMAMPADGVSFMLAWVQGYLAGADEELSMDPDALGKSIDATVAYCKENQEMSVLNATKESAPKE
jgi:acid stress chaperone HdeB